MGGRGKWKNRVRRKLKVTENVTPQTKTRAALVNGAGPHKRLEWSKWRTGDVIPPNHGHAVNIVSDGRFHLPIHQSLQYPLPL